MANQSLSSAARPKDLDESARNGAGPRRLPEDPTSLVALGQGAFYLASGIWPHIHMRSFLGVTGPKEDLWLVRTVGGLLALTGGVLASAALRRRVTREIRALGMGTASLLAAIDFWYVARRRISPVFLLDAAAEVCLAAAWTRVTEED